MAKVERTYNIPLRRGFINTPVWRRSKKAMNLVQDFLKKHMKVEQVKIGKYLNEEIWKHGGKNPPHHVKVDVTAEDGIAKAELSGQKYVDKGELLKAIKQEKEKKSSKPIKEEVKLEDKTDLEEEVEEKSKKIVKDSSKNTESGKEPYELSNKSNKTVKGKTEKKTVTKEKKSEKKPEKKSIKAKETKQKKSSKPVKKLTTKQN